MKEFTHANRGALAHPQNYEHYSVTEKNRDIRLSNHVFVFIESKLDARVHLHERIRPALALHMFNTLREHPGMTPDEEEVVFQKMFTKLMHAEQHALNMQHALPTIGIEVEIEEGEKKDAENRNNRTDLILGRLDIGHTRSENQHRVFAALPTDELEVNPSYAYSAAIPARLLQELTVLGAIRTEGDNSGRRRVAQKEMYSMHVNLGIERNLSDALFLKNGGEMFTLNALCTLAFTSPARLMNRKSSYATYHKSRNITPDTEKGTVARVELRSLEYRDYPTYRLLHEVQLLAACALAFERKTRSLPRPTVDDSLAELWAELLRDPFLVENILFFEGTPSIDVLRDDFIAFTSKTENKKTARSLITAYAQRAKKILKEAD